jgi:hypothetical protein
MAKNYTRPLAEVYQLLEVTRQATGDHLSACIVGPTYDLYRYGIEKDVTGYTYTGAAMTMAVKYNKDLLMNYTLDEKSAKLYAQDVELVILNQNGSATLSAVNNSTRKFKCATEFTNTAIFTKGQPSVGNFVYIKGDSTSTDIASWVKRTIIEVDVVNSTITLDAPVLNMPATGGSVFVVTTPTSGYMDKGTVWTLDGPDNAGNYTVKTSGAISIKQGDYTYDLLKNVGKLYPEFRVLKASKDTDEDIFEITTITDIQNNFGTIAIENDLAYGCYCALRGSAGRAIYAIRTAGAEAGDFELAMKKTEFDSSLYSFAPLTSDPDVADIVVKYNAAMSEPDVKMWRRTLVGVDNPGEYVLATTGNDGKNITATISAKSGGSAKEGSITITSGNVDLQSVALEDSYVAMRPGDKIRVTSTGATYTIVGTTSKDGAEIYAEDAASVTAVTTATNIELIKADKVANTIEYVGAVAHKYATRRASVVFCDGGTTTEDDRVVEVPNRFLAAEIAGISSAVVPQQSITHTVIQGINKASRMYSRYTTAQLDDIAASGVLIVTQDTKGTDCYIRHQLTTEMDKGNLYFEESCTRNLDNISYALADIVNGYIGKANVTTAALRSIKIDITAALTEFTQNSTDDMVGPSLVDWDNLEVYQDPKFKDRVIINVNLYLPLPLNNIKLFAMAYVATVSI